MRNLRSGMPKSCGPVRSCGKEFVRFHRCERFGILTFTASGKSGPEAASHPKNGRRTPLCASAAVKALGGAAALSVPVSGAVFRPAPERITSVHSDSEERRFGDDGLPYTRAEFDAFYFEDPESSAYYWLAATAVGANPLIDSTPVQSTPRFPDGSIVRVLPDTHPGVRPELADGILAASVAGYSDDGNFCFVCPIGGRAVRRTVPASQIALASLDAYGGFRLQGRGGSGARNLSRVIERASQNAAENS